MEFKRIVITNDGQNLMADLISGTGTVKFTKIAVSNMVYSDEQLEGLTSLSGIKQEADISKVIRNNQASIQVEGAVTNLDLTTGYHIQTLGLYAEDGNQGEVLYAVTNAKVAGYMPAYNGRTPSGAYFKLVTSIGNADNVTLEVDPAAVATIGDINALQERIDNNEQTLNSHLTSIVSQEGAHHIRYWEERLEIEVTPGEWIEFKSGSQYPVGNISNFTAKGDDTFIELFWNDPVDVTVDDSEGNPIPLSKWKGTKILRKVGSYPQNENDGVLVVDNGIRDQYAISGFMDTGLMSDTEYYYMAFPYTEDDVFTVDVANRIIGIPTELQLYGFEIDETNSNPKTAVTYIEDAIGMTPASGNNENFQWGSWKEFIQEISKPVVMKAGVDQYDLNYDDYTKKATGGNSILTGADGDVFTKLQHLHMKHEKITNGHRWLLASKPFDGSFSMTEELENGYNQFNNPILVPLQNLYLLIFKDRDAQTALGRGRVDGAGYIESGNTNSKGYMFGSIQDLQMKFLGIEDFWGNKLQWVDGLVSDSNWDLLLGTKNFNDDGTGYSKQATSATANVAGYPMKVQGGKGGYVPADSSASETTGYADYGYLHASRLAYFGGTQGSGGSAGAFPVGVNHSTSDSHAALSARLCYKNADAVYIGAYLGFEQSGKLRSISGNVPTDTKTISQFRTLAQANN